MSEWTDIGCACDTSAPTQPPKTKPNTTMDEFLDFTTRSFDRLCENDGTKYAVFFERSSLREIQRFSRMKYIKVDHIDYNNHVFKYTLLELGVHVHAFNKL